MLGKLRQQVGELRENLDATRAQRDKIRDTRDKLRFKLQRLEKFHEVLQQDHLQLWAAASADRFDLAIPGQDLVEHIGHIPNREVAEGLAMLRSGYLAMLQIRNLHRRFEKTPPGRVLDFGCGVGRVTRFLSGLGDRVEAHGCDIDGETVAWAGANLGKSGAFFQSPEQPPLDLDLDGAGPFDLVFAISVFTHLPEDLQHAWLSELARILSSRGILLATFHGPSFYRFVPPDQQAKFEETGFCQSDLGKTPGQPDYYLTTWHTHDYVRDVWSRYFKVEEIEEQGLNGQDVAVLRPKP